MASNTVRFLKPSHSARLDRPLFVFLPGMDGTGELFEAQLDGLQQEMDVRCLSIPSDDTTPWKELARATAELIRLEKATAPRRPVYVCGESFGGCLALMLARYAPESFDYLILVNPASSFGRQPWGWWSAEMARSIPSPLYDLSAIALVPLLTNMERVSEGNRTALLRAIQSVTQRSAAWRLSLVGQFDLESIPVHRITQPTLLLASTGDRLLPSVEESERLLQHLPNARRVILPDSGHACLLEANVNLGKILSAQRFLTHPPLAS
ncbi:MAG: alpha/beta fold hydrolase [Cyanobacteria bacterium J06638_20]